MRGEACAPESCGEQELRRWGPTHPVREECFQVTIIDEGV
jgi:hypothetical protein